MHAPEAVVNYSGDVLKAAASPFSWTIPKLSDNHTTYITIRPSTARRAILASRILRPPQFIRLAGNSSKRKRKQQVTWEVNFDNGKWGYADYTLQIDKQFAVYFQVADFFGTSSVLKSQPRSQHQHADLPIDHPRVPQRRWTPEYVSHRWTFPGQSALGCKFSIVDFLRLPVHILSGWHGSGHLVLVRIDNTRNRSSKSYPCVFFRPFQNRIT